MKFSRIFVTLCVVGSFCVWPVFCPTTAVAEKKLVKIGYIGPLTGANAAIGLGTRNSADLAVKEANRRGDSPYLYKLIVVDDASDPATGVSVATKLCTVDKVTAATTHYNSPVGLATIHVFHRYETPQVFWGSIHPDITYKNNFPEVTRICANTIVEHDMIADFVGNKLGYKSWSVIYDTTSYGQSCFKAVKNSLAKVGGKILSEYGIPVGTQDLRPILSSIKALKPGPQAIYFGGTGTETQLIKIQMHELGMDDFLYIGVTGFATETYNKVVGKPAEGTVVVGKFAISEDSPFVKAYKAEGYKDYYEASGPYAYDAMNLIIAAINKVGPDDKKLLAKTIRDMEYTGVLGLTKFDEYGQTLTGGLTMKVSQDGRWVPWDKSEYKTGKRKLPRR
ncbi:MAG: branched-chain amino acid ABC transporter substrate-binding protein [Desulfobacterales bacterium]|nr:branched-chain amino acid ABC transporter substrate-binding protein [Desulfobacterales bacterium]